MLCLTLVHIHVELGPSLFAFSYHVSTSHAHYHPPSLGDCGVLIRSLPF